MPILDAGLYQAWIAAFDNHDRAERRLVAAGATGNRDLIEYVRGLSEQAAQELNQAIRALNNA